VIASMSKNDDNHNVVFFAPVMVAVAAADEGVICPHSCLLTSTLLPRRRGGDPSSLKPQSADNNKDNDASIASMSKNNKDHVQTLVGLWTMVELLAQPEAVTCQEAVPWIRGQEAEGEAEAEAEATRGDATTSRCKQSGGGKDRRVRRHMMRGQDDGRGRLANKVEGSRMGDNWGNIH
jgi:hypothetical protein